MKGKYRQTRTKTSIRFALSAIRGELLQSERERERERKKDRKRKSERERGTNNIKYYKRV